MTAVRLGPSGMEPRTAEVESSSSLAVGDGILPRTAVNSVQNTNTRGIVLERDRQTDSQKPTAERPHTRAHIPPG
jgi:hypothetical protein